MSRVRPCYRDDYFAPLSRYSRPNSIIDGEIAAAVLFLCSREASAITGPLLRADGGVVMSIT
jgi:NAD(P)-dependent dehydrogenase (short-subunit alcohol dehydrogenase family)